MTTKSAHATTIDLQGRVALVSGATGHLGSALSLALARVGADLILSSRTQTSLDEVAGRIREETGRLVATVSADLTVVRDVDRLAEEAWDHFGFIDVVICNAAPVLREIETGSAFETTEGDWQRMQSVILWGPLQLLRSIVPKMMERGCGSVITMCSSSGSTPVPGIDAYGLAKGGLQLLTKYLAKECGKGGVRVNGLMPAGIVTDPAEAERVQRIMAENGLFERLSLGRLGEPADLIGPALFLASDLSSYMTGQVLNVDGGRL